MVIAPVYGRSIKFADATRGSLATRDAYLALAPRQSGSSGTLMNRSEARSTIVSSPVRDAKMEAVQRDRSRLASLPYPRIR